METKFFVAEAYRYAESKNWEYRLTGMYNTIEAAKQAYHARLGAIIKNTNDAVMVILFDSFGVKIDSDHVVTMPESEVYAE